MWQLSTSTSLYKLMLNDKRRQRNRGKLQEKADASKSHPLTLVSNPSRHKDAYSDHHSDYDDQSRLPSGSNAST